MKSVRKSPANERPIDNQVKSPVEKMKKVVNGNSDDNSSASTRGLSSAIYGGFCTSVGAMV